MKKLSIGGVLAALVLFCGVAAWGQATSGDMTGTVKDSSGAVVTGAAVTVTSEATNASSNTTTNSSGEYRFENLLPGLYDVKVVAAGFQPHLLKAVTVQLNKASTADVLLTIGATASVEVIAGAGTTLDTTTQNLSTTLSTNELSVLPTTSGGFGVLNASLLVPGVASSGGIGIGEGPSVGGMRPRDNNFTIEGIDNNNKGVTGPLVYVPNDAVADFTLITSQFSPEFGHSNGGQFNTNVLSGTNKYHGALYEYFNNRNLNAESGVAGGKPDVNPRYDFNRYGGQVGGPIIHDKLFAFVNYERQTTGRNTTYYVCTPTAAGLTSLGSLGYGFNATNLAQYLKYTPAANFNGGAQVNVNNDLACGTQTTGNQFLTVTGSGTAKSNIPLGNYLVSAPVFENFAALTTSGDYTISSKDNLRLRYLYNSDATQDTSANLPVFFQSLPVKYHLISLSEFHNFTPNLTNELRLGYNRFTQTYLSGPYTFPGLDLFPNLTFDELGFLSYGPDSNAPQSTVQNLYQLTNNVSWTRGTHTITLGFDGRKFIAPQTFTQRVRGDYEWSALDPYLHDLAPDVFGQRSTGNFIYYGDQTAFYGYGNDTWRLTPTLTLNYGLRYEFTSVPVGERAQSLNAAASVPGLITFAAPKPQYKNFAPRVGFNWSPNGKTSIRGGFGIGYDVIFDNIGLLSFPPQYSSTNSVGDGSTNYTGKVNPAYSSPAFLANGGLPPGNGGLATFSTVAKQRAATAAYVPDQTVPYAESYNLQLQQTIGSNYVASIGYLGTRGIKLLTQVQLNKQPKVTKANQLFTTVGGSPVTGTTSVSTSATASTLGQLNALSAVIPAFATAGFTSTITSYQPWSQSNYNGLTANLTRRMQNGLQMNFSYTWSKTMDDATAEVNATSLTPRRAQDSQCISCDYSRSALDRTHRLTLEAIYDVPFFKHSNFLLRNVVGNWLIAPIYTYESPEYATVLSGANSNLNGDSGSAISRTIVNMNGQKGVGSNVFGVYSSNPALTALCPAGSPLTQQGQPSCTANLVGYAAANPNAYYIKAAAGTLPNAARNTLPGRPIDNVDVTAAKRISFGERYSFEFGVNALNVLNHAQYTPGSVDAINQTSTANVYNFNTVTNGKFNNAPVNYSNNARTVQLAAKFKF